MRDLYSKYSTQGTCPRSIYMFPTRQLYLGPTDQESICPKRSMSRPWYFRELLVEEFLRCEMFELKGATALSNRSTAHKCRLHLLPLRTTEGKRVERNLPKTASIGHTKQAARAAGVAVGDVFKRRVPRYWGWYHLLANHCICDWRSSPTIAAEELPNINHCIPFVMHNNFRYTLQAMGFVIRLTSLHFFLSQVWGCLLYTSPSPRD